MAANITPAQLELFFDRQGDELCAKLLNAEAEAKRVRAAVDEYIEPIFRTFGFKNKRTGEPIEHSDSLYLAGDVQSERFYAACDVAHRERGHDLPTGHCPALIAEGKVVKIQTELVTAIGVVLGFEAYQVHGETRKKLLTILREMFTARMKHNRRLRKLLAA